MAWTDAGLTREVIVYSRRTVLHGAAAASLGGVLLGGVLWSRARAAETRTVRALLPSASHDTLAVKVLLDTPPLAAPVLTIDGRRVAALQMDVDGYAWGFVQKGLKGGTTHELTLTDEYGAALRAPWQLKTLPDLDDQPERFRILFFTCAGGDEAKSALAVNVRRALFDRALPKRRRPKRRTGSHYSMSRRTTSTCVSSAGARPSQSRQSPRSSPMPLSGLSVAHDDDDSLDRTIASLSYSAQIDTNPLPGIEKIDTLTRFTLVYGF